MSQLPSPTGTPTSLPAQGAAAASAHPQVEPRLSLLFADRLRAFDPVKAELLAFLKLSLGESRFLPSQSATVDAMQRKSGYLGLFRAGDSDISLSLPDNALVPAELGASVLQWMLGIGQHVWFSPLNRALGYYLHDHGTRVSCLNDGPAMPGARVLKFFGSLELHVQPGVTDPHLLAPRLVPHFQEGGFQRFEKFLLRFRADVEALLAPLTPLLDLPSATFRSFLVSEIEAALGSTLDEGNKARVLRRWAELNQVFRDQIFQGGSCMGDLFAVREEPDAPGGVTLSPRFAPSSIQFAGLSAPLLWTLNASAVLAVAHAAVLPEEMHATHPIRAGKR